MWCGVICATHAGAAPTSGVLPLTLLSFSPCNWGRIHPFTQEPHVSVEAASMSGRLSFPRYHSAGGEVRACPARPLTYSFISFRLSHENTCHLPSRRPSEGRLGGSNRQRS